MYSFADKKFVFDLCFLSKLQRCLSCWWYCSSLKTISVLPQNALSQFLWSPNLSGCWHTLRISHTGSTKPSFTEKHLCKELGNKEINENLKPSTCKERTVKISNWFSFRWNSLKENFSSNYLATSKLHWISTIMVGLIGKQYANISLIVWNWNAFKMEISII